MKKKHCNWWCAVCGGQYEWRAPNRILVVLSTNANEAKVFKAHAAPQRLCENLINALKLLAKIQTDGDSPIQSILTGLHERTRRGIMDGLRSFVEIDNHKRHSASRCCEDSPHDDPSCLCGSFEDQVWHLVFYFCVVPSNTVKDSMCWFRQCSQVLRSCELGRRSLAQGHEAVLSRSRVSVKITQERPSGKDQMS